MTADSKSCSRAPAGWRVVFQVVPAGSVESLEHALEPFTGAADELLACLPLAGMNLTA